MLTWYSFLLRERSCQWQHEYFITQSFIRAVVIRSIGSPTLSYSEDPTADMSTEEIVVNCEYIGRSLGEFGGQPYIIGYYSGIAFVLNFLCRV